jgi:hypothetical protein
LRRAAIHSQDEDVRKTPELGKERKSGLQAVAFLQQLSEFPRFSSIREVHMTFGPYARSKE